MLVLSTGTHSICMFSLPTKFPFGFAGYIQASMSTFKEMLERTNPLLAFPSKKPHLISAPKSSRVQSLRPHQLKAAAPSTSRRLPSVLRAAPSPSTPQAELMYAPLPSMPAASVPGGPAAFTVGRVGRLAASLLPGETEDEMVKLDEGFSLAAHLVNDRLRLLKTHNRIASQCGLLQLKDKAGDCHTISVPVYMVLCCAVLCCVVLCCAALCLAVCYLFAVTPPPVMVLNTTLGCSFLRDHSVLFRVQGCRVCRVQGMHHHQPTSLLSNINIVSCFTTHHIDWLVFMAESQYVVLDSDDNSCNMCQPQLVIYIYIYTHIYKLVCCALQVLESVLMLLLSWMDVGGHRQLCGPLRCWFTTSSSTLTSPDRVSSPQRVVMRHKWARPCRLPSTGLCQK